MSRPNLGDLKLWAVATRRPPGVYLTRVGQARVAELRIEGYAPPAWQLDWMENYLRGTRAVRIHEKPIDWYCSRLYNGDHFSFAGFSDAEWCCILGLREGEKTALGQVLTAEHGRLLLDVIRQHKDDPRFLFAVPKCLFDMSRSIFSDGCIDWFLGQQGIKLEGYERDMVTDDLARDAGLYPFIQQLQAMESMDSKRQQFGGQAMPVAVVGPQELGAVNFLPVRHFVPIESPNLHTRPGGIDDAVSRVLGWRRTRQGPVVVLVSAGVSAAVIISRLHNQLHPGSYLIDCGSIWDGFVGIGGQREWRANLYANPAEWEVWKRKNLTGA